MSRMFTVLALVALGGCSTDRDVAREAISGGVADATSSAVVGIVDDRTSATCTGSLIAPNLVLTAQHCVAAIVGIPTCADDGRFGSPGPAGSFHVTTRPLLSASPGDYRSVAEVVIPPGGDRFCGRDVALLRLASSVGDAEASPIAPRFDPAPAVDELYTAVGFGGTGDFGEESGERRRREGLRVACVSPSTCADAVPDVEWVGEASVCPGDSGGPALDASGSVMGVASRGAVGCASPVYVGLGSFSSWLRAEGARAATLGGYAPAAWVSDGAPIDAGATDAGPTAPDAAIETDGGSDAGRGADAASTTPSTGGCSVSASARPSGSVWALALALCFAIVRRARSVAAPRRAD